jgi:TPR repeat protein
VVCAGGHTGRTAGLYNLAFLHFRGLGVPQDTARAVQLLEQAADGGSVEAAWALYHQYCEGEYVAADPVEAMTGWCAPPNSGSSAAACLLAQQLERPDQERPPQSAWSSS